MKTKNDFKRTSRLTSDSEGRLLAYATAASMGAFFAGQSVKADVVESPCLGPYPRTFVPGTAPIVGTSSNYFYFDIDGDHTNDFNLTVETWRVTESGFSKGPRNIMLNPRTESYIIPWTNGMYLGLTNQYTGLTNTVATYKNFMANALHSSDFYLFNNFSTNSPMAFEFLAGDNQRHFGYIDLQINNNTNSPNANFTATVYGVYWNTTPLAGLNIGTVPPLVVEITNINVGPGNSVTINFTSSDYAVASAFALETSPVLGPSAIWTTDGGAVITSSTPGVYQAVTSKTGGLAQFYRISH